MKASNAMPTRIISPRASCSPPSAASTAGSGTEDVEIVSLMGTVSEHGSHLHASLAHRDLSVFGGHLRPGCLVNTTAEIVLAELPDTVFTRERDEATGYEELAIRRIDRQF